MDNLFPLLNKLRADVLHKEPNSDQRLKMVNFFDASDAYLIGEYSSIDPKYWFIRFALIYIMAMEPSIPSSEISQKLEQFLSTNSSEFYDLDNQYQNDMVYQIIYIWARVWRDCLEPDGLFDSVLEAKRTSIIVASKKLGLTRLAEEYVKKI